VLTASLERGPTDARYLHWRVGRFSEQVWGELRERGQALEAIDEAMKDKADGTARSADLERRLAEAERTVGKLALENELLGKASRWLT